MHSLSYNFIGLCIRLSRSLALRCLLAWRRSNRENSTAFEKGRTLRYLLRYVAVCTFVSAHGRARDTRKCCGWPSISRNITCNLPPTYEILGWSDDCARDDTMIYTSRRVGVVCEVARLRFFVIYSFYASMLILIIMV